MCLNTESQKMLALKSICKLSKNWELMRQGKLEIHERYFEKYKSRLEFLERRNEGKRGFHYDFCTIITSYTFNPVDFIVVNPYTRLEFTLLLDCYINFLLIIFLFTIKEYINHFRHKSLLADATRQRSNDGVFALRNCFWDYVDVQIKLNKRNSHLHPSLSLHGAMRTSLESIRLERPIEGLLSSGNYDSGC